MTMRITVEEATAALAAAQKPGRGVPAYLRWVNRPLGGRFAVFAAARGMTPNHVTALSAACGAVAVAVLCLWIAPAAGPVAALLLLIGYVLDSADGQLARIQRTGGPAGEWLDHVVDGIRGPAVHVALAVHLYRADAPEWILAVCLLFSVIVSSWFLSQLLAEKLTPASRASPGEGAGIADSFMKQPQDVSTTYAVIALLPLTAVFSLIYPALLAWHALMFAGSLVRKHRQLSGR